MDKRLSLWYNEIGQKRRIRIKLLALMVMWRFRVPLIRVEASLRLSDLMYHTKQKNGGYFYARQGLPHGDLLPPVP